MSLVIRVAGQTFRPPKKCYGAVPEDGQPPMRLERWLADELVSRGIIPVDPSAVTGDEIVELAGSGELSADEIAGLLACETRVGARDALTAALNEPEDEDG